MTFNEFKHWMDGYSEGIEGSPTEKQWERIQAQIKEVCEAKPAPSFGHTLRGPGVGAASGGTGDAPAKMQGTY